MAGSVDPVFTDPTGPPIGPGGPLRESPCCRTKHELDQPFLGAVVKLDLPSPLVQVDIGCFGFQSAPDFSLPRTFSGKTTDVRLTNHVQPLKSGGDQSNSSRHFSCPIALGLQDSTFNGARLFTLNIE